MTSRVAGLAVCFGVVAALAGCGGGSSSTDVRPTPQPTPASAPSFALVGFATLNGGTTGGKGGSTVDVATAAALRSAAEAADARIIRVTGKITSAGFVRVTSNKTIVGVGSEGELDGFSLDLTGARNVIVRNLKIHHVLATSGNGDAVHVQNAQNVWIDHCELYSDDPAVQSDKDLYDGLLDVTQDSAFVTVSWCYLHDHWKGSLVGSSDEDNYDRRATYHHNYFRNVNSRVPSYRFGKGHVFNNYYLDIAASGVNSRMGAVLRVDGNSFERVRNAVVSLDSNVLGYWDVADNLFVDSTGMMVTSNGSFAPPYAYTLDASSTVKATVTQYAGVGKTDPLQNLP
jgi:pectate lyase